MFTKTVYIQIYLQKKELHGYEFGAVRGQKKGGSVVSESGPRLKG